MRGGLLNMSNIVMEENKNNLTVTKSNTYILGHYNFSPTAQKIVCLALGLIKERNSDREMLRHDIPVKEIKKYLGISSNDIYKTLDNVSSELVNQYIEINNGEQFEKFRPFPYSAYKNGVFSIEFHSKMKPHISQITGEFTRYMLSNVRELSNSYSLRIYEILKLEASAGIYSLTIPLSEFKEMIGLKATLKKGTKAKESVEIEKYSRFTDVKKFVLEPVKKEISEKTDLSFEYNPIRKGRAVDSIEFVIREKDFFANTVAESLSNEDKINIMTNLSKYFGDKITLIELMNVLEAAFYNADKLLELYEQYRNERRNDCLYEFFIESIKNSNTIIDM